MINPALYLIEITADKYPGYLNRKEGEIVGQGRSCEDELSEPALADDPCGKRYHEQTHIEKGPVNPEPFSGKEIEKNHRNTGYKDHHGRCKKKHVLLYYGKPDIIPGTYAD